MQTVSALSAYSNTASPHSVSDNTLGMSSPLNGTSNQQSDAFSSSSHSALNAQPKFGDFGIVSIPLALCGCCCALPIVAIGGIVAAVTGIFKGK
jgi:hypothetical protein